MGEETSSSGPPPSWRRQAAFWAGVGVLVAGLGVLGYAVGVADDVYPTEPVDPPHTTFVEQYGPPVARGFAAVCGLLAVVPVGWVLAVAWLGATGRSTTFPRPRFLASVGVLLSMIWILSFVYWVYVNEVPFPGDRALLVTAAYGIVLLGTVVVRAAAMRLWSSAAPPQPWSRRGLAPFVGGAMGVVVAAGVVVAVAGEHSRVDATTSVVVQAPAAPTEPTRMLWRWSAGTPARPGGRALIREAVAAGAGVVVATGDGIVALDGRTGQERWHYRLTGTRYYPDLAVVDGGRAVVVSFDGRLHAFDAVTGELRWRDDEATAPGTTWRPSIAATDSTVVRRRDGTAEFTGTDARTGETRWQYTLPTPPSPCGDRAYALALRDTVIIHNELCSDFVDLTVLDGATGELLWHESPLFYDIDVRAGMILGENTDVRLQFDARNGHESGVGTDDIVLAADSGELLTSSGTLFEVSAAEPRWQLPRDPRPKAADAWYSQAATFLGDAALLVDIRESAQIRLTIVDRADGTVRRSFGAADLPAARNWTDVEVFSAPGAVVVTGSDELVALG